MTWKFSRDPALWLFLINTAIRIAAAFWLDTSDETQALLNAICTAVAGLIIAFMVRRDGQVAAILGLAQAVLALALGLGLDLSAETQALIMSFVGALAAAFIRTQVLAPVNPTGDRQIAP